ncbi:MAG TPA: TetR/AcrR family transcriptional regulator [Jatrophihabitantaceae bacterium]|nr:TetR/AcrR family transcriptional regulator [Jatrophihabitantaceae bacterium]
MTEVPPPATPPLAGGPPLPLRGRLVGVATELFAAQGYEATSVQQIVQAAGATKGGFYHHFASKDELLFEVYHRVLAEQTRRLEEIASGPGDPAQRLTAVVADVIATSVENLDELTVYLRSAHALPEDQRAAMRAERRRYHLRVRRLIEEGQRSGAFTADVPADVAVHFLYGAINQLVTWYRRGGKLSPSDLAAHFDRLILTGLRT